MKKINRKLLLLCIGVFLNISSHSAEELTKTHWIKVIIQSAPEIICQSNPSKITLLNKLLNNSGDNIQRCKNNASKNIIPCLDLYSSEFPAIVHQDNPTSIKIFECIYIKTLKSLVFEPNQMVVNGNFSLMVSDAVISNTLTENEYLNKSPDGKYLFVTLTIRNDDSMAHYLPEFSLLDMNGNEYEASNLDWRIANGFSSGNKLNPNIEKKGQLVFDVPPDEYYFLKISGNSTNNLASFVEIGGKPKQETKKSEVHKWVDKKGVTHFND